MTEPVRIPWPYPWMGLITELDTKHIPAEALSACTNMYFLTPRLLRSRGGIDLLHTGSGGGNVKVMYYWDRDSKVYFADDSAKLWKDGTAITGPAENVTDMVSYGLGATPTLIVAEEKGSEGHTLHTYDGTTYATLTGTAVPECTKLMVRHGRLWGTCSAEYPSSIYACNLGQHTLWRGAFGDGFRIDVAPAADGDILDWVDFDDILYVQKEHALYRITGNHPMNYNHQKLHNTKGSVTGTIADCAKGVLYATKYGIFPVGVAAEAESEDLTGNVETDMQAILGSAFAGYSPELGAYLVGDGTTKLWVSNHNNRPDVWTNLTAPAAVKSIYQGNKLYLGAGSGKVYEYVHTGYEDDSAAFTVSFKTGDWDVREILRRKNIRFIEGDINAFETATATVGLYEDAADTATFTAALAADARNLIRRNLSCERAALEVVYTSLTAPCGFAGAALRIKPGRDVM